MQNLKIISWDEDRKYSLVSGGLIYTVMENLVDPAFDNYMNSIRRLIPKEEEKEFERITAGVDKLSNSCIPELIFFVLIYGIYFLIVSIPIYQFLLARWFWRWMLGRYR